MACRRSFSLFSELLLLPLVLIAAGLSTTSSRGSPQLIRHAPKASRVLAMDGIVAPVNQVKRHSAAGLAQGALLQGLGHEHMLSSVSARWEGKVVYAVFTSSIEKYHKNLLTELETWGAKPHAEGRFVAMGPRNYPKDWQEPGSILSSDCEDDPGHLACKEAWLLAEGAARDVAWLVIIGEDNWIHTDRLEAELKEHSLDDAVGLGTVGCGRGRDFCEEVTVDGGFCGGSGYALNRAAIKKLMEGGSGKLKEEYTAHTWPNDMQTSCSMRKRNIKMDQLPNTAGFPMFSKNEILGLMNEHSILHYVQPPTMRWMHAVTVGRPVDEVQKLEKEAFDRGCCRGMNNTFWAKNVENCLKANERNFLDEGERAKFA